jgi:hypothetical protein
MGSFRDNTGPGHFWDEHIRQRKSTDVFNLSLRTKFCIPEADKLSKGPEPHAPTHREQEIFSVYKEQVYEACSNRRYFITRKGRFGLAPSSAQPGDKIVIFPGTLLPMAISRESNAGREFNVLAGECFMPLLNGDDLNAIMENPRRRFVAVNIE